MSWRAEGGFGSRQFRFMAVEVGDPRGTESVSCSGSSSWGSNWTGLRRFLASSRRDSRSSISSFIPASRLAAESWVAMLSHEEETAKLKPSLR